jgi:hypothetical protein
MSFIKIIIIILLICILCFLLVKNKKEYLENVMENIKTEEIPMEEIQMEDIKRISEIIKKIEKYETGHSCSSEESCLSGKCENDICIDTKCDLDYPYIDSKYKIDEECGCNRMCISDM